MSLTNPNKPVTESRLQEFYHKILPYLGNIMKNGIPKGGTAGQILKKSNSTDYAAEWGDPEGGGHTIKDSSGTDLTQRDIMQFGAGFNATDDSENEKTVVEADVMQSGDMDDIVTPLPSIAPKKEGIKYSTTEQVIGEWIDNKPIYQKTIIQQLTQNGQSSSVVSANYNHGIANVDKIWINFGASFLQWATHGFSSVTAVNIAVNSVSITCNSVDDTSFNVTTGGYDRSSEYIYLTVLYTKTTDTATT